MALRAEPWFPSHSENLALTTGGMKTFTTGIFVVTAFAMRAFAGTFFGNWEMNNMARAPASDGTPPAGGPAYYVFTQIKPDRIHSISLSFLCYGGEYSARLIATGNNHKLADRDRLLISVDGGDPRTADASNNVSGSRVLEAKIAPETLDWIATAKSTISVTLSTSKQEHVFNVMETGRAIAALQAACR